MTHPFFPFGLVVAAVLSGLSLLVVLSDAAITAYGRYQARRRRDGGIYGVVVNVEGRVVGTYLDPFATRVGGARLHDSTSAWAKPGPLGEGWAWEGFGETPEEARLSAERLRHRHLRLFPWMAAGAGDDDAEPEPWRG